MPTAGEAFGFLVISKSKEEKHFEADSQRASEFVMEVWEAAQENSSFENGLLRCHITARTMDGSKKRIRNNLISGNREGRTCLPSEKHLDSW